MSQTLYGTDQHDQGCIIFCELIEACHDQVILSQRAKHALDNVALSVLGATKQYGKPGLGLRFIERSGMTGAFDVGENSGVALRHHSRGQQG